MSILLLKWDDEYLDILKNFEQQVILLVDDYDINVHKEKIAQYPFVYKVENTANIQQVIAVLSEIRLKFNNITHVISFSDYSHYSAAVVASILELPYPNLNLIHKTRDKRLTKHYVNELGVNTAHFLSLPKPINDQTIKNILEKFSFPFIVKPVDLTASQGVKLIENTHALEQWKEQILNGKLNIPECYHFMAEEYIEGDEYHVDIVWHEKKPLYTFVGKNYVPLLETVGNKLPNASIQLDSDTHKILYDDLVATVVKAFEGLGIHSGATMTEVFLTKKGKIYLSDLSIRPSGGGVGDCIKHMIGESLRKLDIRARLGIWDNAPSLKKSVKPITGFINLAPKASGTLQSFTPKEELYKVKGVVDVIERLKIGDNINIDHAGYWCTFVIVKGTDEHQIKEAFHELLACYQCTVG